MTPKRPTTIAAYIRAAPPAGRSHLRRLHALLKEVAPDATGTIKWGQPFRTELAKYRTTKNYLQIPYDAPLPEALIHRIAKRRVQTVREHGGDAFWS